VPALLAATGGLIFEELDGIPAFRAGNVIHRSRLPIPAVLSRAPHEKTPFATEDTEFTEENSKYAGITQKGLENIRLVLFLPRRVLKLGFRNLLFINLCVLCALCG
jgi:hypothetical protein